MKLVLFAVLFLTASVNSLFAQRIEYLNKHSYRVYDTLQYEYAFFKVIQEDSGSYKSQTFTKGENIKIAQYTLIKDESGADKSELSLRFYEIGKLKSNRKKDFRTSQEITKEYYENGQLQCEINRVKDEVVSESYFSDSGEAIAKPDYVQGLPKDGMAGWNAYLSKTLRYPDDAIMANQEGKVFIVFELSEDGKIINPEIGNPEDVFPSLAKEALRAVKNYPYSWTPYTTDGVAEKQVTRLPVMFKLVD